MVKTGRARARARDKDKGEDTKVGISRFTDRTRVIALRRLTASSSREAGVCCDLLTFDQRHVSLATNLSVSITDSKIRLDIFFFFFFKEISSPRKSCALLRDYGDDRLEIASNYVYRCIFERADFTFRCLLLKVAPSDSLVLASLTRRWSVGSGRRFLATNRRWKRTRMLSSIRNVEWTAIVILENSRDIVPSGYDVDPIVTSRSMLDLIMGLRVEYRSTKPRGHVFSIMWSLHL